MKKKLLFVINVDWALLSHRLPIALEAIRQGHEVHLAAKITDRQQEIESYGITVHPLGMNRGRAGVVELSRNIAEMFFLFRKLSPDIVHLVTIKPVLFGGLAARLARVPFVVAAVTGLGFVFMAQGTKAKAVRALALLLYRMALGGRRRVSVIFQNDDDRACLVEGAGLPEANAVMIRGSGVDLSVYEVKPEPEGVPVVMLAARLLADKGVREFVSAAKLLKEKGRAARFCLVGSIDPDNPTSLTEQEIAAWVAEGVIENWGHSKKMAETLAKAHIVALPSYREGLPKVLIEAAACGRAVVTTDVTGCRDAIINGQTGILVPVKDPPALAAGLDTLLADPALRQKMGAAARVWAERSFDVRDVVAKHLALYRRA